MTTTCDAQSLSVELKPGDSLTLKHSGEQAVTLRLFPANYVRCSLQTKEENSQSLTSIEANLGYIAIWQATPR